MVPAFQFDHSLVTAREAIVASKEFAPESIGGETIREIFGLLLTQIQLLESRLVAVIGCPLQVIEELTTACDQHKKTATRGMILLVRLEVLGQLIDPLREHSNLHVGTPCVLIMHAERLDVLSICHIEICRARKYVWVATTGKQLVEEIPPASSPLLF